MNITKSIPTDRPVTWQDAKFQCGIEFFDNELRDFILKKVDAATAFAETEMSCSLCQRTINLTCWEEDVKGGKIFLPYGPIASMTSVVDADENPIDYVLKAVGKSDRIVLQSSCVYPITVTYVAGYSVVPSDIQQTILAEVATFYRYREAFTDEAANAIHKIRDAYRFRSRAIPIS